ncbi:rhodanese-like domain-containing protein [Macrococcus armenti]|uniref:Rhodanese-like domain-containing protein n=1 Tax=Macrococcus armenti TaxID=2875764 RepID=A0ABY3ZWK2_9STAP|nr:rhodanese-like domain-containing protein [Macrococcus armenti]UOB20932.1 rhodanese-like domain-containing protein [Macrococcus armenti]
MNTITVNSLKQLLEQNAEIKLIDVREIEEFEAGHINEAINIPLSELDQHISDFNKEDDYIIICRSGNRSGMACDYLQQFDIKTTNVQGGMIEWTRL